MCCRVIFRLNYATREVHCYCCNCNCNCNCKCCCCGCSWRLQAAKEERPFPLISLCAWLHLCACHRRRSSRCTRALNSFQERIQNSNLLRCANESASSPETSNGNNGNHLRLYEATILASTPRAYRSRKRPITWHCNHNLRRQATTTTSTTATDILLMWQTQRPPPYFKCYLSNSTPKISSRLVSSN